MLFRPWEILRTVNARKWASCDRNCYEKKVERINFMLRLKCLRSSQNEYFRIRRVETLCSRVIRFKPRLLLGIDIIPTFLSALFQCSRFVWITPFLVVLLLTWIKVCFSFQITETQSVRNVHKNTNPIFRDDYRQKQPELFRLSVLIISLLSFRYCLSCVS